MIMIEKETNIGHFKGDEVRLTGKKDDKTYSITMHEAVFTEGPNIGEKIWNIVTFY